MTSILAFFSICWVIYTFFDVLSRYFYELLIVILIILWQVHECKGKFHFYICIGMLLISLSCWCKGKYSRKYSLGFSEESYQGEYNFLSCCGSLSIMNTMKTIQDTKCPFQQSIAELFSVDNFPNVVHHFFQSVLLASKSEWYYEANKLNYNYCNLPEEGYETASRTVVDSQCLY